MTLKVAGHKVTLSLLQKGHGSMVFNGFSTLGSSSRTDLADLPGIWI